MNSMLNKFSFTTILTKNLKWFENQQNSILSAATIIAAANIASAFFGLIRQHVLVAFFFKQDSGRMLEAFSVAFQIPDTMFQLIVIGSLSAAFIPLFMKQKKESEEAAFRMSSVVLNILAAIFVIIGAFVFVYAEPITRYRTGMNFTTEQVHATAQLTRIMLVAQLFFVVSSIFGAILQSYQRFIVPSIAPILYNVGIVAGVYFLSNDFGIYAAGIGVALGAGTHMLVQAPFAFKYGFKFRPTFSLKTPGVKELFRMMPPRVLSIGIEEIKNLSLGFFATTVGNLSFWVMQVTFTLMTIPIRLFGTPIGQASLPFLSDESQGKDTERFRELVVQSLHYISFLALPASVILLILRIPIVRLAIGAKEVPWATTLTIGRTVAIIAISITAQAMVQLLLRAFYALKDTKTPFYITLITVAFYLAGCSLIVYFTEMRLYGLALMTTIAAFIELGFFLFFLNRKIKGIIGATFFIPQAKICIASFLMAVFLYLPFRILDELVFDTTRTIELIGLTITTGTIGMIVYFYFAALFDIKELAIFNTISQVFMKNKQEPARTSEVAVETHVEDGSV